MEPVYIQIRRIVWIVQTLRNQGPHTFEELNDKWTANRISEGKKISSSTFYRTLSEIELAFGLKIIKRGGRFRIDNPELLNKDFFSRYMLESISTTVICDECRTMSDRIVMDRTPSDNGRFFLLSQFVKNDETIKIEYGKYEGNIKEHIIDPYALKYYQNRWYLLGRFRHRKFCFFSLDRIHSVVPLGTKFNRLTSFDAPTYLADVFGVYIGHDIKPVKVTIQASSNEACYLRDVPIHDSQQEMEGLQFSYFVKPTSDFISKLISRGSRLKVLEPQWVIEEVKNTLIETMSLYH